MLNEEQSFDIPSLDDLPDELSVDELITESADNLDEPEFTDTEATNVDSVHMYVSSGGCGRCDAKEGDFVQADDFKTHDNCECETEEVDSPVEVVSFQEEVERLSDELEQLESDYETSYNDTAAEYNELETNVDEYNNLFDIAYALYDNLKTDGFEDSDIQDYIDAYAQLDELHVACFLGADIYNTLFEEANDYAEKIPDKRAELDYYLQRLEDESGNEVGE